MVCEVNFQPLDTVSPYPTIFIAVGTAFSPYVLHIFSRSSIN